MAIIAKEYFFGRIDMKLTIMISLGSTEPLESPYQKRHHHIITVETHSKGLLKLSE